MAFVSVALGCSLYLYVFPGSLLNCYRSFELCRPVKETANNCTNTCILLDLGTGREAASIEVSVCISFKFPVEVQYKKT